MNDKKRITLMKANLKAMRDTTILEASVMEMGRVQREKELREAFERNELLALAKEYNKDLNLLEAGYLKLRKEMEELTDFHIKCFQGTDFTDNIKEN